MAKISSKYLNMEGLSALINASRNKSDFDGAILMTSFGMVVGNIVPTYSETEVPHAAELVYDYKEEYVTLFKEQNKDELEIIGDGSLVVLENATVIYSNNNKVELDEITIHCDDVIGFTPVNIEKFKSSL